MRPIVMVVDDNEDIRAVVADILTGEGFDTVGAADGAEALARLAEGVRPCVVLLDLMMPGMNGWEFSAVVRADPELSALPVVVISGAARVAETAAQLRAVGFLVKPFDMDQLVAVVRRHAGAPAPNLVGVWPR